MTREQIIAFWGRRRLWRWPESRLNDHNDHPFRADTISFLSEVGLPYEVNTCFHFGPWQSHWIEKKGLPALFRLGTTDILVSGETSFYLAQVSDSIIWVEDPKKKAATFVNTSVHYFCECLTYLEECRFNISYTSRSQLPAFVAEAKQKMQEADPEAFANPETFWNRLIQSRLTPTQTYWLYTIKDV